MPPFLWYNGGATIEIRRKAGICKAVDEPLSKGQNSTQYFCAHFARKAGSFVILSHILEEMK